VNKHERNVSISKCVTVSATRTVNYEMRSANHKTSRRI